MRVLALLVAVALQSPSSVAATAVAAGTAAPEHFSNKVRHVSIHNILAFDSSARFGAGVIVLYAWAPVLNLRFYIVKSAGV